MLYINFKGPYGVETVETLQGIAKSERKRLLTEYNAIGDGYSYYFSQRASKEFYRTEKDHNNEK